MAENSGGADGQREAAAAEALKQEENKSFLGSLNESEVQHLFCALNLEEYKDVFKKEQFDGQLLLECDEAMLKEDLKISNRLHRKRLLLIAQGKHSAKEKLKCYHDKSSVHVPEPTAGRTRQESGVSRPEENTDVLSPDDVKLEIPETRGPILGPRVPPDKQGLPPDKQVLPLDKQVLRVIFHVLVSDAWQWDDKDSRAHIRFGHPELGDWQTNCGEVTWSGDLDETLTEMVFTVPINIRILQNKRPLPYRYAFYTGYLDITNNPLEQLFYVPRIMTEAGGEDVPTRCLVVPEEVLIPGGEYHKYDMITYPSMKSTTRVEPLTKTFLEALKRKMGYKYQVTTSNFIPLRPESMVKSCLQAYLHNQSNYLLDYSGTTSPKIDVLVQQIMEVYQSLFNGEVFHTQSRKMTKLTEKFSDVISKVMLEWLQQISECLLHTSQISLSRRLISGAAIVLCMLEVKKEELSRMQPDVIVKLCRLVTLKPQRRKQKGTQTQECLEYNDLCSELVSDLLREKLSCAICTLCHALMKAYPRMATYSTAWLKALPLHHFLGGLSQPFGKTKLKTLLSPQKICFSSLYDGERRNTQTIRGFVDAFYNDLKQYFDLDPHLLQIFIFLCPLEDLPSLFQSITPYQAVAGVAKLLQELVETTSAASTIEEFHNLICDTRLAAVEKRMHNEPQECNLMLDMCLEVLNQTKAKALSAANHHVKLMSGAISLVLFGLQQVKTFDETNSEIKMTKVLKLFPDVLKKWIANTNVIGEPTFGCRNLSKAKEEFELWDTVLKLTKCPIELKCEFQRSTEEIIRHRLNQLSKTQKITILGKPAAQEISDPILIHALVQTAADVLIKLEEKETLKKIQHLTGLHKTAVLMAIVTSQYPGNHKDITLCVLLEWKLWPAVLREYSVQKEPRDGHMHAGYICMAASEKFIAVWKTIEDSTITFDEMVLIQQHEEHVKNLLDALRIQRWQSTLENRLRGLNDVLTCRIHLGHLRENLCESKPEGFNESDIDTLERDCDEDLSKKKLSETFQISGNRTHYPWLSSDPGILLYAQNFYTMTFDLKSSIFFQIWKEKLHKTSSGKSMLEGVKKVWEAALDHCVKLIDHLKQLSVKLTEVDRLFQHVDGSQIKRELTAFYQGICKFKNIGPCQWISSTTMRVQFYKSFRDYVKTAETLLKMQKCLNLTGDFAEMDKLVDKVRSSKKERTLKHVDETMSEIGESISDIANHRENLDCLESFVECQDIVNFLKDFKDVEIIRKFVNDALTSGVGGEDAFVYQKLSNLEFVGIAFKPILFDLKKDVGCRGLVDKWAEVWREPDRIRDLSDKLKSCEEVIEWFKEIQKEIRAHGSVKATTFSLMETLEEHGLYHIGVPGNEILSEVSNAVKVVIKRGEPPKRLQNKQHSLSELYDLQGRLVLIGSNYKASIGMERVNDFRELLQSVCQVAKVLLALQHKGDVKYVGWSLKLPCGRSKQEIAKDETNRMQTLTKCMQELAKTMENELEEWQNKISIVRQRCYECNYFTDAELLWLRRELARAKGCSRINPAIMFLLKAVSCEITETDVNKALLSLVEFDGTQTTQTGSEHDCNEHRCLENGCKDTVSEITETKNHRVCKGFLKLSQLQNIFCHLSKDCKETLDKQRPFGDLQSGSPNLLITEPENVLETVISLYMLDWTLPLPTMDEVLLCTETTTAEEIILLWRRAVSDPKHKHIFCLVHSEKLPYHVADRAIYQLFQIVQGKQEYRLVIICGRTTGKKLHIVTKLQAYERPYRRTDIVQEYLRTRLHFDGSEGTSTSLADPRSFRVRVVRSNRAGMGKSLYIQRLAEKRDCKQHVIIPLHGPSITTDSLLERLKDYIAGYNSALFHIDVAPSVLLKAEDILFSLLVLGGLTNSLGRVWRCTPTQVYAVEITIPRADETGKEIPMSFLEILPKVECISPKQHVESLVISPGTVPLDLQNFRSKPFQLVYQYLKAHTSHRKTTASTRTAFQRNAKECLNTFLRYCRVENPSWAVLNYFISFLNRQFELCEDSVFCNQELMQGQLPGFKPFVIAFVIEMSKEFATSSLKGEVALEQPKQTQEPLQFIKGQLHVLETHEIAIGRHWEQRAHPYLVFNRVECEGETGGATFTFFGFKISKSGDLLHPELEHTVIKEKVATPELLHDLIQQGVDLNEDWKSWSREGMIFKLATVIGLKVYKQSQIRDPDRSYVLTVDNLIKMLAIQMRFRCNIPVIVMGETGCGKTRLIRFMCELAAQGSTKHNLFILKVHGGTSENEIMEIVEKATREAEKNKLQHDTVVFFDEVNTTEAIGLIKEIMCDRRAYGKQISTSIKLIAACNPYRKHSPETIKNLESAGLGFYQKHTQYKLGDTPLRHLVYRVLDLPPSMRPLVYDYGQLTERAETEYILQIVKHHIKKTKHQAVNDPTVIKDIAEVLCECQRYMRHTEGECRFVSLRDVERAMIVFEYFLEKLQLFQTTIEQKRLSAGRNIRKRLGLRSFSGKLQKPPIVTTHMRALILTLSVCYHTRLLNRGNFEDALVKQLSKSKVFCLPKGVQPQDEIAWFQEALLDNMKLHANIARNAALRENVVMMVVCIELRIPLFVVGKPGSSKSLAKTIVESSMTGKLSQSKVIQAMKQVQMFSYQCSQLSKSDSIVEIFNTAQKFQESQNKENKEFVSVVVLDEVGLAEDSASFPLKVLHPLLEDGTSGAGDTNEVLKREERVAFIGLSNWALDPAKMNRGIMVIRTDPTTEELVLSARGICSNQEEDPVRDMLEEYFHPLAEAYQKVVDIQEREFFGLRDFYSLIKMLYWICDHYKQPPTYEQILYALKRNFEGFEKLDTIAIFMKRIYLIPQSDALRTLPKAEEKRFDCSEMAMIKASLESRVLTWHGENRYLLLLTENYAALQAALHVLNKIRNERCRDVCEDSDENMEPVVLFGSSFPRDREYTQVIRNIDKIKLCMEAGRTVILLNLENLYEILYDVLNQYYFVYGADRFVDIGLHSHKMKCRVHENFKVVLIAEEGTVYESFPTPLINRMEKHRVVMNTILEPQQKTIHKAFLHWIDEFVSMQLTTFTREDVFVGYHNDTPAMVVFQASNTLAEASETDEWKDGVLYECKKLLLQTATSDSLVRLKKTTISEKEQKDLMKTYFRLQQHSCLCDYVDTELRGDKTQFIQITTHDTLPSSVQYEELAREIKFNFFPFFLQEFDTEAEFTGKICNTILEARGKAPLILVIQCDALLTDGGLIACARHLTCDTVKKLLNEDEKEIPVAQLHVLYIIRIPRRHISSTFNGFQAKPWISVHIDCLCPQKDETRVTLQIIEDSSLANFFKKNTGRLYNMVPDAISMLEGPDDHRNAMRVQLLQKLMIQPTESQDEMPLFNKLEDQIFNILREYDEQHYTDKEWIINEAMNLRQLQIEGTLHGAIYRKLDQIVVPVLAEIIALIDHNNNLDLISGELPMSTNSKLWLDIFDTSDLCRSKLTYEVLFPNQAEKRIPRQVLANFNAKFPFSWLIQDSMSVLLNQAIQTAGHTARELHAHMCKVIEKTPMGEVFKLHWSTDSLTTEAEQLPQNYLHDFIRLVYKTENKGEDGNEEHKTVKRAIEGVAGGLLTAARSTEINFITHIAAIHVAYHSMSKELLWFNQLCLSKPQVLGSLSGSAAGTAKMELHLQAASVVVRLLADEMALLLSTKGAEFKKTTHAFTRAVYDCQIAINSILRWPTQSDNAKGLCLKIRVDWQHVQAMQLFLENVVIKHPDTLIVHAQKLNQVLRESCSDFTKLESVEHVVQILQGLQSTVHSAEESKVKPRELDKSCHYFFIEVVSNLCFGWGNPEPAVIDKLTQMVFENALELSRQHSPHLKSCLLHFLYVRQCDETIVQYLDISQRQNQQLSLLCLQCYEDSIYQQISEHPPNKQLLETAKRLGDARKEYTPGKYVKEKSKQFLYAVGWLRYGLTIVAGILHKLDGDLDCNDDENILLQEAQAICTDAQLNQNNTGPAIFLVKQLFKRFGLATLLSVSKKTALSWVLPQELSTPNEVDPFIIHGKLYFEIRGIVSAATGGRSIEWLDQKLRQFLMQGNAVYLFLALYMMVTLQQQQLSKPMSEEFQKYIERSTEDLPLMKKIGIQLSSNTTLLPTPLQRRKGHSVDKLLNAMIMHTIAVFAFKSRLSILQPFIHLMERPGTLKDAYIPTMPQDTLSTVKKATIQKATPGKFCKCPNGHIYLITECGGAVTRGLCHCGKMIGGINYHLAPQNKEATIRVSTAPTTGYILGMPSCSQSATVMSDQTLSPVSCTIVRLLLHSVLFWASGNKELMKELQDLPRTRIKIKPAEFFWSHLKRDIEQFCEVTQRSIDDSALIVHLVLQQIMQLVPKEEESHPGILNTMDDRTRWERRFEALYISPVIQEHLDAKITDVSKAISEDLKGSTLFEVVNEKGESDEPSMTPHLWSYRPKVTVEHLSHYLEKGNYKKRFPILHQFLKQETCLRATKYLPEIVRLQQYLYNKYNYRMDLKAAQSTTFEELLNSIKEKPLREEYSHLLNCLKKAWSLVGEKLLYHSRVCVEEESMVSEISKNTTLDYLIPTTSGHGVCTTSLVDFLVQTHNEFINRCRTLLIAKGSTLLHWRELKVPIDHINACHLIDCEQQLESIILFHCDNPLGAGHDQKVNYNLRTLERHILRQFIAGKPMILLAIPQVIYQKDIYTSLIFAKVRGKIPQVPLARETKEKVIRDGLALRQLKTTVGILVVVLGFLSSGSANPKDSISSYVQDVLKKRLDENIQLPAECALEHTISLWKVLSVEMGKLLIQKKERPLDIERQEIHQELTEEQREQLGSVLGHFDLDYLLEVLLEFILTHVKHYPPEQLKWTMVETIEPFLDDQHSQVTPAADLWKEFPESITVSQSVCTWTYIMQFKEKLCEQK